jgi:hypothetical protein
MKMLLSSQNAPEVGLLNVLAWQGARADNFAALAAAFAVCGFMAVICLVAAGQLRSPKRRKGSEPS